MRKSPWVPCLVALSAVWVSSGCRTLPKTPTRPVPIQIIDAESKAPVAGAEVKLWCPNPHGPKLGKDANGVSGPDGIAHVHANASEDVGIVVEVSAPGYIAEEADFHSSTKLAGKANATSATGETPPPTVIELFAGPRPVVELVLPDGFRGLVKAEVRIDNGSGKPGQRTFSFPVSPAGAVEIVGPAVLNQGPGPDYRARFASGTQLPLAPKGMDIGFRWLRCEGNNQFFVVGTEIDWEEAHRAIMQDGPRTRGGPSGGQGPGGHGRGGRRRGGQ